MSVVAAAAAAAASYGQPTLCGGGGARKRKDVGVVVLDQQATDLQAGRGSSGDVVAAASASAPARRAAGLFVLETVEEEADEERSSSIGAVSEDDGGGEDEEEEVDSGRAGTTSSTARGKGAKGGALACMDALDDALPIKRGLSNFFSGKSRSFANLQDAASAGSSARDLAKPENPFNKRRRVLRCCSIRRVASTSLTALPPFLPPTAGDDSGCGGTTTSGAGCRSG